MSNQALGTRLGTTHRDSQEYPPGLLSKTLPKTRSGAVQEGRHLKTELPDAPATGIHLPPENGESRSSIFHAYFVPFLGEGRLALHDQHSRHRCANALRHHHYLIGLYS